MKRSPLQAGFTLGFIGGGQLARMSALQAFRFGMNIAVYATSHGTEPVEMMTPRVFRGGLNDASRLRDFAAACDVVTLENEFVDSAVLRSVQEQTGTPIYPSPESFRLIENKLIEKQTFEAAGIPVAAYRQITTPSDLDAFGSEHGWPYVLKSAKGGYDGYGNATVRDSESAVQAWSKLGGSDGRAVLAEAFVPFTMELAVMVARNATGTVVYPCVESIQQGHICKEIIAPARVPESLRVQVQELAVAAVEAIDGVGLFGFEFFLTHDNRILLNESAPRPHNSGHYTIEACVTSQFENHIRAVTGLPLGSAAMRVPAAVMVNVLGSVNGPAQAVGAADILATRDAHLHIYGKSGSRTGRKMAHLTVLGADAGETLEQARKLEQTIQI
ncbi:MAG: phosphoribosylaminoimidazole carboxylase ATPase subunit PurK [Bacteroidetes bacterium HLUCCA01]|nr:MAG: phosphoribosylaminoimidazole carboxylase ATPase subunit PurK [Bacteroidetes bacterium HLUCCA01]